MSAVTFDTILCPVDFSACSRNALEQAVDLVRRYGSKIYVLHVIQPIVYPIEYGLTPPAMPEVETETRAKVEEGLQQLLAEVDTEDVALETRVIIGLPSKTICEVASELGADLIVIGTRGLTGLDHVLLGSTAERVVRTASCPVLSIKVAGDQRVRAAPWRAPPDND